jgi:STE24 endopeptidase
MSEMTATRIGRLATVVVLAAGWLVAATLLWRTSVPSLDVGGLDVHRYFPQRELDRAADYQRLNAVLWAGHLVATIAVLLVLVRRAPRLARTIALGRVGTGVIVAMVMMVTLWFVSLPFGFVAQWWAARHGLAPHDYVSWIFEPWALLTANAIFALAAVALVLGLAGRFGDRWWLAGAPAIVLLGLVFSFVFAYAARVNTHAPRTETLRSDIRELETTEGVSGTPVRVQPVSSVTNQANAFATGFGPSKTVVLWDTLLDGRFSRGEIRVVVAHELGHVSHKHILKGVGWSALFVFPVAWLITLVARRRGNGIADPGTLPLVVLTMTILGLVTAPFENVVTRRFEAEAEWSALKATNDPASARRLFMRFERTSLQEPNPATWEYVLLETHPTIAQRIAMAERFRTRASPAGS